MHTVTLSEADYQLAVRNGIEREQTWKHAKQSSMPVIFGPEEHLIQNIKSTAAEIAVARFLDADWIGEKYDGPLGADVAPNIEVRTRPAGKPLWIKDREVTPGNYRKRPTTPLVQTWMTDDPKTYTIVGFIQLDYGWSCSKPWRRDGKLWGWEVAVDDLWPIERLRKALHDS